MADHKFETDLFANQSVSAEMLHNKLHGYYGQAITEEIIEAVIREIFASIRDDWDPSIAMSIRTCLESATRIHDNAERTLKSHPYLLSSMRNGTSQIRMELEELATELGVDPKHS